MPKPKKNESKQDFLGRCSREVMGEGKDSDQAYAMCNAFWDDAKSTRNTLSLSALIELVKKDGGKDDEPKSFMITAYTGQLLDLGWFGKLVFDVQGMQAKEKFPVLREHKRDRVVGIGTRSWRDEKRFYMGGDFVPSTRDGREVLDLAEKGFPWQASVGIWPKKVKVLDDEKESMVVNGQEIRGPAEVWLESLVGEVSFVSLGADDQTAAIVLSDQSVPVEICRVSNPKKEEENMDFTLALLEKEAPELLKQIREAARAEGLEAGRTEATAGERKRVADIMAVKGDGEATATAIAEGLSADGAYKLFFEAEKARKTSALNEIETEAPESAGARPPKDQPPKAEGQKELMTKAKKLALEKKITVAQAMRELQAENPDLISNTLPRMHVVVND